MLTRFVAVGFLGMTVWSTGPFALADTGLAFSCPLLVSPSNSEFQQKRIQPNQVAAKNSGGCLSPSDAIYGPDGCPTKLCGANSGVISLPSN